MKWLFIILISFTGFQAMGQVQFSSLQEVLDYADRQAISIQIARQQELIAASNYQISKNDLLPSINGTGGFNDNITLQPTLVPANLLNPAAPEGAFNEYTFGRKYLYSTGIQANWEVLNFQKWFALKTSDAKQSLSEAYTLNTKFQVYNQLAQTYYSILISEKYLEISQKNITTADSIFLVSQDKYQKGIFTEENLNRSKIQLLQTQQQASDISASLLQLYNQLQTQLHISEKIVLTEDLSQNTVETASYQDIARPHPELVMQESQVRIHELQVAQTKALRLPVLSLGYQYNYSWATDDVADFSNANYLPQQFWGIKFSVPLVNVLHIRSKTFQSKTQAQIERMYLEDKVLSKRKEDENLQIQYNQCAEDLLIQKDLLRLQTLNDYHTNNLFASGIIGIDERLDKYQDLLNIQNQYMQRVGDYYISYYKYYIRATIQ